MIKIVDNFTGCKESAELVRKSALLSGFGSWTPNSGDMGKKSYGGMNYVGLHYLMVRALRFHMGCNVYPNMMFFRMTIPGETDSGFVHSDREQGSHSCVSYLSENGINDDISGTAFFRHRKSGLREMPTIEQMKEWGILDQMNKDILEGKEDIWEQTDFVSGVFNRALIFDAPLFHSRWPREGYGSEEENGRLVWVCHFVAE